MTATLILAGACGCSGERAGGGQPPIDELQRGVAAFGRSDFDAAVNAFTDAIRRDPTDVAARAYRGAAYMQMGRYDQAIADQTEAIRLDPSISTLYNNRGSAYRKKGEYAEALADFERAVEVDASDALARGNLAWFLATCPEAQYRDGRRAIEHATRACELTHRKVWNHLSALAAAYAEVGDFDRAVESAAAALPLAPAWKQAEVRERLALYRQGKPFRRQPPPPSG